jgi:hypothetical protein
MRPLASLSCRQARLVLPAAALLTVIGGTTAAAAPVHAGPPQARAHTARAGADRAPTLGMFTWHPLTLVNRWVSASTTSLQTGKPAWAVQNGVVYLRGAVKRTAGGSSTFATLPASARPAHNLYIQVYTNSDTPGILYIGADGTMEAYDGNATTFTSISAVSYPTAAVKSTNLALENGWASSQPNYDTGNPAYAVSHGVVYLSGSMHGGSTSAPAFVLPKAARPAHAMYVSVYTFDGSTGFLEILPTGQVDPEGADAASYTSLANISFPVASTAWHDFKLEAGWKSADSAYGTGNPAYAVINGIVYIGGSMDRATGGTGLWTDLPAATRSVDVLEIEVYTVDGTTGAIAITNSLGLVSSNPFTDAEQFTSLAAIAYPPSS